MAEVIAAVGLIASVASIAAEGTRLSQALSKFIGEVRNAEDFMKDIAEQVQQTSAIIGQLEKSFEAEKSKPVCTEALLSSIEKSIAKCSRIFHEIENILKQSRRLAVPNTGDNEKPYKLQKRDRLRWPFRQSEIELLWVKLDKEKTGLNLQLMVISHARQLEPPRPQVIELSEAHVNVALLEAQKAKNNYKVLRRQMMAVINSAGLFEDNEQLSSGNDEAHGQNRRTSDHLNIDTHILASRPGTISASQQAGTESSDPAGRNSASFTKGKHRAPDDASPRESQLEPRPMESTMLVPSEGVLQLGRLETFLDRIASVQEQMLQRGHVVSQPLLKSAELGDSLLLVPSQPVSHGRDESTTSRGVILNSDNETTLARRESDLVRDTNAVTIGSDEADAESITDFVDAEEYITGAVPHPRLAQNSHLTRSIHVVETRETFSNAPGSRPELDHPITMGLETDSGDQTTRFEPSAAVLRQNERDFPPSEAGVLDVTREQASEDTASENPTLIERSVSEIDSLLVPKERADVHVSLPLAPLHVRIMSLPENQVDRLHGGQQQIFPPLSESQNKTDATPRKPVLEQEKSHNREGLEIQASTAARTLAKDCLGEPRLGVREPALYPAHIPTSTSTTVEPGAAAIPNPSATTRPVDDLSAENPHARNIAASGQSDTRPPGQSTAVVIRPSPSNSTYLTRSSSYLSVRSYERHRPSKSKILRPISWLRRKLHRKNNEIVLLESESIIVPRPRSRFNRQGRRRSPSHRSDSDATISSLSHTTLSSYDSYFSGSSVRSAKKASRILPWFLRRRNAANNNKSKSATQVKTKLEGYILRRKTPRHFDEKSWSQTKCVSLPLSQDELGKAVDKFAESRLPLFEVYQGLSAFQQEKISELIRDRNFTLKARFEWVLIAIFTEPKGAKKMKITSIQIYLQKVKKEQETEHQDLSDSDHDRYNPPPSSPRERHAVKHPHHWSVDPTRRPPYHAARPLAHATSVPGYQPNILPPVPPTLHPPAFSGSQRPPRLLGNIWKFGDPIPIDPPFGSVHGTRLAYLLTYVKEYEKNYDQKKTYNATTTSVAHLQPQYLTWEETESRIHQRNRAGLNVIDQLSELGSMQRRFVNEVVDIQNLDEPDRRNTWNLIYIIEQRSIRASYSLDGWQDDGTLVILEQKKPKSDLISAQQNVQFVDPRPSPYFPQEQRAPNGTRKTGFAQELATSVYDAPPFIPYDRAPRLDVLSEPPRPPTKLPVHLRSDGGQLSVAPLHLPAPPTQQPPALPKPKLPTRQPQDYTLYSYPSSQTIHGKKGSPGLTRVPSPDPQSQGYRRNYADYAAPANYGPPAGDRWQRISGPAQLSNPGPQLPDKQAQTKAKHSAIDDLVSKWTTVQKRDSSGSPWTAQRRPTVQFGNTASTQIRHSSAMDNDESDASSENDIIDMILETKEKKLAVLMQSQKADAERAAKADEGKKA